MSTNHRNPPLRETSGRASGLTGRACALLLCLMLAGAGVAPVHAQGFGSAAVSRQGFWYGGGLGRGYTDLACGICGGERENGGISGYLRAGGTLTRSFLLGGELDAWRRRPGHAQRARRSAHRHRLLGIPSPSTAGSSSSASA